MRVAVTGSSGHVGANLCRALLARGDHVRALVREDIRAIAGLSVERVKGDIFDRASLERAFEGAEIVYNLAAHIAIAGDEDLLQRVNVAGARNVASACLRTGVRRLVHTSSVETLLYRGCRRPIDESNPPPPELLHNSYGRSKARGDREVHAAVDRGLDAVLVCPTAVIGPYDYKPSLFGQMFIDFALGRLPAMTEGGFDLVSVDDVARGMIAAAERGRTGEHYLLGGEWIEVASIARILEEETGVQRPRFSVPGWLGEVVGVFALPFYRLSGRRPRFTRMSIELLNSNFRIDSSKARRELGHAPRPPHQAIAAALQFFRDEGIIPARIPRSA